MRELFPSKVNLFFVNFLSLCCGETTLAIAPELHLSCSYLCVFVMSGSRRDSKKMYLLDLELKSFPFRTTCLCNLKPASDAATLSIHSAAYWTKQRCLTAWNIVSVCTLQYHSWENKTKDKQSPKRGKNPSHSLSLIESSLFYLMGVTKDTLQ